MPERSRDRAKGNDDAIAPEFGSFSDLGLDMEDTSSMPWWRKGRPRAEVPAFDTPVERDQPTDVIGADAVAKATGDIASAGEPLVTTQEMGTRVAEAV